MTKTKPSAKTDGTPPFHLVNPLDGKHIGPFSTMSDALLARYIGGGGWGQAQIMDREAFDAHLSASRRGS